MKRARLIAASVTVLLSVALSHAAPAAAVPGGIDAALTAVETSGGHYVWARASLQAADCSGLVSVAMSIATGQPIHRIGDTHSLLAGRWPGVIPGADPSDAFIIATSPSHMMAVVNGVPIESRVPGQPYRIGDQAADPWGKQFTAHFHVDPALLIGA